ncbi:NEDD4-binding protein 2-like 2 [Meriones unguiculatus]|uniref:NEDD4-binding protein 2-like 2 n=1 Tax=Meriones unguiculatus TaxID=10047 RepID=UPI00293E51AC|nr:NEDD4-binding protein 2-like 2 [Meriones unguiculatus]
MPHPEAASPKRPRPAAPGGPGFDPRVPSEAAARRVSSREDGDFYSTSAAFIGPLLRPPGRTGSAGSTAGSTAPSGDAGGGLDAELRQFYREIEELEHPGEDRRGAPGTPDPLRAPHGHADPLRAPRGPGSTRTPCPRRPRPPYWTGSTIAGAVGAPQCSPTPSVLPTATRTLSVLPRGPGSTRTPCPLCPRRPRPPYWTGSTIAGAVGAPQCSPTPSVLPTATRTLSVLPGALGAPGPRVHCVPGAHGHRTGRGAPSGGPSGRPSPCSPGSGEHQDPGCQKLLILLRGLPGSGKTTLSRALLGRSRGAGVVCSADDYFRDGGGYRYRVSRLGDAHGWSQSRARRAMAEGRSPVIIDNTNTQAWEMRPYVEMAIGEGYRVEFQEPETWWKFDPEELEKRNQHGVSRKKIARMLARYDFQVSLSTVMTSVAPDRPLPARPGPRWGPPRPGAACPGAGDPPGDQGDRPGAGDLVTLRPGAGDLVTLRPGAGDLVTLRPGAGDLVTVVTGPADRTRR